MYLKNILDRQVFKLLLTQSMRSLIEKRTASSQGEKAEQTAEKILATSSIASDWRCKPMR